jgi:hypothetical protein
MLHVPRHQFLHQLWFLWVRVHTPQGMIILFWFGKVKSACQDVHADSWFAVIALSHVLTLVSTVLTYICNIGLRAWWKQVMSQHTWVNRDAVSFSIHCLCIDMSNTVLLWCGSSHHKYTSVILLCLCHYYELAESGRTLLRNLMSWFQLIHSFSCFDIYLHQHPMSK